MDFRVVSSSSRTTEKSAATLIQGSRASGTGRAGSLRSADRGQPLRPPPDRHPLLELVGGHRPGDVEALRERATELGGQRELPRGLDALGEGAHAAGGSEAD